MKTMLLGDVARIKQGYTFKPKYQGQQGKKWPYIKVADVGSPKNTKYLNVYLNSIDDQALKEINVQPFESGSIVFPRVGAALRNNNKRLLVRDCLTDDNVIVITVKNTDQCYNEFLYYWFVLKDLAKFCNDGLVPVINAQNLKIQKINLPSLSEQKAIADLLSIWDEAIEKTERLIQERKNRFKYLLNDLIHKGRINHSWKGFNLGDLCHPITQKNEVNETNVLTSSAQNGLISQLEYYNKSVSADDVTGYYLLKRGDFAYNRSSAKGHPFGATKRLDGYEQGVLSTLYLCFSIKPNLPCDSDFLLHLFESGSLNRELRAVCQEGARSHGLLNITKPDFFGIKVFLPGLNQQKQIASVLNAAQKEIDLLKQLLEKY
ncbi:MAG: hypothetical protein HGB26_06295 [Desulfobulbaceae bacterium]|nr:hypothetical protein [Desulfobulbaceae bacterium]